VGSYGSGAGLPGAAPAMVGMGRESVVRPRPVLEVLDVRHVGAGLGWRFEHGGLLWEPRLREREQSERPCQEVSELLNLLGEREEGEGQVASTKSRSSPNTCSANIRDSTAASPTSAVARWLAQCLESRPQQALLLPRRERLNAVGVAGGYAGSRPRACRRRSGGVLK